jgi:hypothetical protein
VSQLKNIEKALFIVGGSIVETIKVGPKKTRSAYRCLVGDTKIYLDPSYPYTVKSILAEIELALFSAKNK